MIDLKQLRYFITLAETLNMRRAARILKVKQPTLSQHISKLEERLGVWLLERPRSGMRLTGAGAAFLQDSRRVLFEYDRAVASAGRSGRAEKGQIAIGIFSSLSAGRQRDLLTEFTHASPGIEIEFVEEGRADRLARLRDRRLDIAFMVGRTELVGLEVMPGWTEALYAALPDRHELSRADRLDWAALRRERILVRNSERNREVHNILISRLMGDGESPNVAPHLVGRGALLNLVGIDQGITVVTEATTGIRFPGVVFRRIDEADAKIDIGLAWHPENLNPILIVIIIGLSILDFSAFAALEVRHLTLHLSGSGLMQPPSLGQAIGMPQR